MGVAMGDRPTRGPGRWRVPRWMLGAVMLPVAVLASVATSQGEPETLSIVSVGDAWAVSGDTDMGLVGWDGEGWAHLEVVTEGGEQASLGDVAPRDSSPQTQWVDCSPSQQLRCYRAVAEEPAVEVSADGGVTWRRDWGLSDADVAALLGDGAAGSDVAARGVGIASTREGEEVWVALGTEGLAVRHPDGTWERVGFQAVSRDEEAPAVIPSEFDTRTGAWAARGFGYGLVGTMAFGPNVALFAALAVAGRVRGERWRLAGVGVASLAAFPLLTPVILDHVFSLGDWPHVGITTLPSLLAWLAGVAALWGLAIAAGVHSGSPRRAFWMTAAAVVPAGIAAGWLTWHLGGPPYFASLAGAVVAALAVVSLELRAPAARGATTPHGELKETGDA